jgi:hypothetical protein
MRIRAFVREFWARREGRAGLERSVLSTAARDLAGWTGWGTSAYWDRIDEGKDAYVKSLDPKIPPSIFVSQRDRTRQNIPIPLVERMIDDHGRPDSESQDT